MSSSKAAEVFEYNRSIRAWGMGAVQIPFVEDTEAVTNNPAALGFVSAISWEMLSFNAGLNGMDAYNNFRSIGAISSAADYNNLIGKKIWVGGGGKMALATPMFGLTLFNDSKLSGVIRNPAFPEFDASFFSDTGLAMGFALPLGPAQAVGLSVKQIDRWGGSKAVGIGVLASGSSTTLTNEFNNKGRGFGFDAAYMLKLPTPLQPTFGVVWQDVGSTTFVKTAGTDAPTGIKDNLSAALGIKLDWPGIDMSAGMEYKHIMDTGIQIGKKLHFGTEVSLPLIDIRAGLSQGYPTYGLGFSILFMEFEFASATVEAGEYPGQTPESRLMLGMSFSLAVDANFNMSAKDGKRRKLKQRR